MSHTHSYFREGSQSSVHTHTHTPCMQPLRHAWLSLMDGSAIGRLLSLPGALASIPSTGFGDSHLPAIPKLEKLDARGLGVQGHPNVSLDMGTCLKTQKQGLRGMLASVWDVLAFIPRPNNSTSCFPKPVGTADCCYEQLKAHRKSFFP